MTCVLVRFVERDLTAEEKVDLSVAAKFVNNHCLDCHNSDDSTADLNLDSFAEEVARQTNDNSQRWDTTKWELIVRRLRARQMPPPDYSRPDESEYVAALSSMERALDTHAKAHPHPGRTSSMRRLTRTEYRNAIRDLLGIEIPVESLLPADESSHGFDNVTVGELSPTLLNRYITAAEKISRLAVATQGGEPDGVTIRVPPDVTQEGHIEGLPLGTRGGVLFKHLFPGPGEYIIRLRLARDRDEKVEGLNRVHQIDLLVDSAREHQFTVKPAPKKSGYENVDYTNVDAHLKTRIAVTAGMHEVGVTFPRHSDSLLEIKRQPFDASFNRHRHPRQAPAIMQVSIVGPMDGQEKKSAEDSNIIIRGLIAGCRPRDYGDTDRCATQILRQVMRLAYRRPVDADDLKSPMMFFQSSREARMEADGNLDASFDAGMEAALASILVNPNFLFRIEEDPADVKPGTAYEVSDLELASRLSFFLWSSIPDAELLELADSNRLRDPKMLREQVSRMISDGRSSSLVENFASQWLYLRNLASITPDLRAFPDFDHNLRESFRRETELLFEDVLQTDQSVLRLLDADTTWLNERLAKHYGVPHVRGSHFRKVDVSGDNSRRGGLLRHGSMLMLTSYATRTSPTVRDNWILENILGTPPPPPPPNVPSLAEKKASQALTIRERLAQHRADGACASCHNLMDPIGFSLDNFDAVGRWRERQGAVTIDSSGSMPDGTKIHGVDELERAIIARPEIFVGTLTEKLMTFALGRGVEPTDAPAIRKIVREASDDEYKISKLLEGIVFSEPFQTRLSK